MSRSLPAFCLSATAIACASVGDAQRAAEDEIGFSDGYDYGQYDDGSGGAGGGTDGSGGTDGMDGSGGTDGTDGSGGTDGTDGSGGTDGMDGSGGTEDTGGTDDPAPLCSADESLGTVTSSRITRSTLGATSSLQLATSTPDISFEETIMGATIGPDRVIEMVVPAGQSLRIATVDSTLGSGRRPWALALLESCEPASAAVASRDCRVGGGTCVDTVLVGHWSLRPMLYWENTTRSDRTLYLLLDEDQSTVGGDVELEFTVR